MKNADALYRCRFTFPSSETHNTHTHTAFGHELLKFWKGVVQIAQFELKFVISLLVVEQ